MKNSTEINQVVNLISVENLFKSTDKTQEQKAKALGKMLDQFFTQLKKIQGSPKELLNDLKFLNDDYISAETENHNFQ
jgi:hypothetical protein